MNLAEVIYRRSLALPEPAAREALDFIEFLGHRYGLNDTAEQAVSGLERRIPGSAKGKLQIIDDDDSHLSDFDEYLR
ncbi:DUF2281 domain-containing protein [Methylomonas sp. UP202]|uniref:DUF2281 domain-containing protein n=1 Tax=Methylomonas sp. UP202 TaxID=3040943 RepID=UPI002479B3A7|nr:DUF2281 domain-containing protein [Methylomonas sp. UP202]WGS87734.1 DUF2281 domain-containing protein [Methylomonas sp. UP202]